MDPPASSDVVQVAPMTSLPNVPQLRVAGYREMPAGVALQREAARSLVASMHLHQYDARNQTEPRFVRPELGHGQGQIPTRASRAGVEPTLWLALPPSAPGACSSLSFQRGEATSTLLCTARCSWATQSLHQP